MRETDGDRDRKGKQAWRVRDREKKTAERWGQGKACKRDTETRRDGERERETESERQTERRRHGERETQREGEKESRRDGEIESGEVESERSLMG